MNIAASCAVEPAAVTIRYGCACRTFPSDVIVLKAIVATSEGAVVLSTVIVMPDIAVIVVSKSAVVVAVLVVRAEASVVASLVMIVIVKGAVVGATVVPKSLVIFPVRAFTVEMVAHTDVMGIGPRSQIASVIPAAPTVHAPAVPTAVDSPEGRPSEIEVGTMRVARVDGEVPIACVPI